MLKLFEKVRLPTVWLTVIVLDPAATAVSVVPETATTPPLEEDTEVVPLLGPLMLKPWLLPTDIRMLPDPRAVPFKLMVISLPAAAVVALCTVQISLLEGPRREASLPPI